MEERVVVAADADEPLTVVLESMGTLYEVPAGSYLTVGFRSPPGSSGGVSRRTDYVSICPAIGGTMNVWTAEGAEIDLDTGCPEES
ncbi:hypothetical protein [Kitasatospora sp. NPDC057500]|uniref:hypothetical protein n=1 Tax=Kitasatospora sp. NPDC057500 TaxID=3346151 RepID=UPI0036C96363